MLAAGWGPAQPPPAADADCGCSPASSPDSWGSVPACSPVPSPRSSATRAALRAPAAGRRGARGGRLGAGQRQSASEREKLRMRTLARALQELRRFLPPSVAPAGQSLTKIETLRLAIRYIGHLSAVLGLSEDSLQRRRRQRSVAAPPRGCALCPDGGPAEAQTRGCCSGPAAGAAVSWGSPPARPGALAAPELRDPPVLYDRGAACPEGPAMEPSPSSPVSIALLRAELPPGSAPSWGGTTYRLMSPPHTPGTSPRGVPPPAARLACSLSGATRLACAGRPSGEGREGGTGDAEGPPESGARERGHPGSAASR